MVALTVSALLALAALSAQAQDATVWVDVPSSTDTDEVDDVEKRYTNELGSELQSAKDEALLLYTEFSGKSGLELKMFLKEMTGFANKTLQSLNGGILNNAPEYCRSNLETRLKKIEHDAKLAASFSGVNHHKFLLGHMIVFRMHLNKSEDYIQKCDKVIQSCGISCESTPRVRRWRRHAADELHRVRDDIQHSRRSYHDLLTHAHRHLNRLRRQANNNAKDATDDFERCYEYN